MLIPLDIPNFPVSFEVQDSEVPALTMPSTSASSDPLLKASSAPLQLTKKETKKRGSAELTNTNRAGAELAELRSKKLRLEMVNLRLKRVNLYLQNQKLRLEIQSLKNYAPIQIIEYEENLEKED